MLFHLGMVIIGLIMVGFAFWAIHYRTGFLEKLGGIIAPLGVLITIFGGAPPCSAWFFSSPFKDIVGIF
jgi:hypothetical protein